METTPDNPSCLSTPECRHLTAPSPPQGSQNCFNFLPRQGVTLTIRLRNTQQNKSEIFNFVYLISIYISSNRASETQGGCIPSPPHILFLYRCISDRGIRSPTAGVWLVLHVASISLFPGSTLCAPYPFQGSDVSSLLSMQLLNQASTRKIS